MSLAQRLRSVGAMAIVAIGVPSLVITNIAHGSAGSLPAAATVGNTVGSALGTTGRTTTAGTTSGTATTGTTTSASSATNYPADKMTVSASRIAIFSPNTDVTLLSAKMRTSNPADLAFSVTLECSIVTQVTTMGNDTQSAMGNVTVWVEVDGKNVGVLPAQPGQSDNGQVTFCNRTYTSTTSGFTVDNQATIKTFQSTKDANAFNWVAMNVGADIHTISVHATLSNSVTDPSKDTAQAVVGNRTVVVNTTQTAQNEAQ